MASKVSRIAYTSSVLTLGSSSLQRIEATNLRLQRRFSEIEGFIKKLGDVDETPQLSAISVHVKTPKISLMQLNAALMKNAEVGQRKWSSIGVDEWIQAGRWWMMKVCLSQMMLLIRYIANYVLVVLVRLK